MSQTGAIEQRERERERDKEIKSYRDIDNGYSPDMIENPKNIRQIKTRICIPVPLVKWNPVVIALLSFLNQASLPKFPSFIDKMDVAILHRTTPLL